MSSRQTVLGMPVLIVCFVALVSCETFDLPMGTPIGDIRIYYNTFNSVRAITADGSEHTIAGGGLITDIFTIRKLDSRLYTGNKPNGLILDLEPSGLVEILARQEIAGPQAGSSGVFLSSPTDLAFRSNDTALIVANLDNSLIEMDLESGEASVFFDAPLDIPDMFGILYEPSKSPYIYVTVPSLGEIHMIVPETKESSVFAFGLGNPCFMAFNADSDILVTDPLQDYVYRIPTDCSFPCDPPAPVFQFSTHDLLRDPESDPVRGPYGIDVNSGGEVFVAVNAGTGLLGRLVKISADGFDVSIVKDAVPGARGVKIP